MQPQLKEASKLTDLCLIVFCIIIIMGLAGCTFGGGGHHGGPPAPPAPPVSGGTLSAANYAGTQTPGDWWDWSSSTSTLAGIDTTTTINLETLTATDQANGYYKISDSNYLAFAIATANFLWVLPVSGSNTTPPLAFNPIFAAKPPPCDTTPGTTTYNVVNFTNTTNYNTNQFWYIPPIDATVLNDGTAMITSVNFNNVQINITGLTCDTNTSVWTGSNGLTIIASGGLLIGDLGSNTTTGFPTGTTGFIAVIPAYPSLDTLNQAHFVMADAVPTTADTANPGAGRFITAGELGGTNTVDDLLYVYAYGGCQAATAGETYPATTNNPPTAVGDYVWSVDTQSGVAFIQYHVPPACGYGGTFLMLMGQLGNGKLIGLPVYDPISSNIGAPILIQE